MKHFKNAITHLAVILMVLSNIVMGAALHRTLRNIIDEKNIYKKGD